MSTSALFQQRRRIKRGWMNLKVTRVQEETPDTSTFFLVNEEENTRAFDYFAGQYLTFRFDDLGPKPLVRSYTLSSSPQQTHDLAFTVKKVEGGIVSNWLVDQVKEGDTLRARGPIGQFIFEPDKDQKHLCMVAGGSGVTPFISIIREFQNQMGCADAPEKLSLLVSYRTEKDMICHAELEQARQTGVDIFVTLTRPTPDISPDFWTGRIDQRMLSDFLSKVGASSQNSTLMTCGPQAIMDTTKEFGLSVGFSEQQIKMESFES